MSLPSGLISAGDIETKILSSAAAKFPPHQLHHRGNSTFVPSAAVLMYIVHLMDCSMIFAERWTDNCMGWVPPYTRIYISTLFYIQVLRAMSVADAIPLDLRTFLTNFLRSFPLETLWIPGPLVRFFKDMSVFSPDNSLGYYVTPALPARPGWSRNDRYALPAPLHHHLPNVSALISRLHAVCACVAHSEFYDSPIYCGTLFRRPCDNSEEERRNLISPGMSFIFSGSHRLWKQASTFLSINRVPPDFDVDADDVYDTWPAFLRFGPTDNWFGPVSAMMSSYCQFWKGSAPLSDCYPGNSAAGGVKCTVVAGESTLFNPLRWVDHRRCYEFDMVHRLTFNCRTTIRDIPPSVYYSAITFCHNLLVDAADAEHQYGGAFWRAAPDVLGRDGVTLLHTELVTMVLEYHSDSRLQLGRN